MQDPLARRPIGAEGARLAAGAHLPGAVDQLPVERRVPGRHHGGDLWQPRQIADLVDAHLGDLARVQALDGNVGERIVELDVVEADRQGRRSGQRTAELDGQLDVVVVGRPVEAGRGAAGLGADVGGGGPKLRVRGADLGEPGHVPAGWGRCARTRLQLIVVPARDRRLAAAEITTLEGWTGRSIRTQSSWLVRATVLFRAIPGRRSTGVATPHRRAVPEHVLAGWLRGSGGHDRLGGGGSRKQDQDSGDRRGRRRAGACRCSPEQCARQPRRAGAGPPRRASRRRSVRGRPEGTSAAAYGENSLPDLGRDRAARPVRGPRTPLPRWPPRRWPGHCRRRST